MSGQDFQVRHFGVVGAAEAVDYAQAETVTREYRPHMIIAGSSAYPRVIDFARLRTIADQVGALLVADVAHVSGLIVAGMHPDPVPVCDIVTTSTHKTLCGPRTGGLILCRAKYADAIDAAVSPGLQAASGAHIIAGRAVLFQRVAQPAFRELMRAVATNAKVLAERLRSVEVPLFTGGTDTHMVVVDLRDSAYRPAELVHYLFQHGILANTVGLPSEVRLGGGPGLRLGSIAMTIRGADEARFGVVAECLATLLENAPTGSPRSEVRERIAQIALECPVPAH